MSACRIRVRTVERAPTVPENTPATVHISTAEPTAKVTVIAQKWKSCMTQISTPSTHWQKVRPSNDKICYIPQ